MAWRADRGDYVVPELCMLKNQATQTLAFCASEAVQILEAALSASFFIGACVLFLLTWESRMRHQRTMDATDSPLTAARLPSRWRS